MKKHKMLVITPQTDFIKQHNIAYAMICTAYGIICVAYLFPDLVENGIRFLASVLYMIFHKKES